MGKQKRNRDKKDKKRNKDRDREKQRQRKDKKKRDRKRNSSSSQSSSDSSDSSSSEREKIKRKDNKIRKNDTKQTKHQTKSNNPYDFKETVKPVIGLTTVNLPIPGSLSTPPLPAPNLGLKPKTKEIHIFKLLPKLPFGALLFGKMLYSSQFIQQKSYNRLLKQMMDQVEEKIKPENNKKAMNIVHKCRNQIQKIIAAEEQKKKCDADCISSQKFLPNQKKSDQQNNRFTNLKNVYEKYFAGTLT